MQELRSNSAGSKSAAVVFLLAVMSTTVAADRGLPSDSHDAARDCLQLAFNTRFNFDLVQVVELTSAEGEFHRTLQMATKRIDGRLRGLGYFIEPVHLRRTRLLMIENSDRSDDFFLFLPAEKRVRRISSSQRKDAFMGTDLTYEDFERRYVDDYVVEGLGESMLAGEAVYLIKAKPRYESGYSTATYYIATSDYAILEVRHYRDGRADPTRIQRAPRSGMVVIDGHILPTVMEVESLIRKSRTVVKFTDIHVNPQLDDAMFSKSALEVGRPIPFLGEETPRAAN